MPLGLLPSAWPRAGCDCPQMPLVLRAASCTGSPSRRGASPFPLPSAEGTRPSQVLTLDPGPPLMIPQGNCSGGSHQHPLLGMRGEHWSSLAHLGPPKARVSFPAPSQRSQTFPVTREGSVPPPPQEPGRSAHPARPRGGGGRSHVQRLLPPPPPRLRPQHRAAAWMSRASAAQHLAVRTLCTEGSQGTLGENVG